MSIRYGSWNKKKNTNKAKDIYNKLCDVVAAFQEKYETDLNVAMVINMSVRYWNDILCYWADWGNIVLHSDNLDNYLAENLRLNRE